MESSAWHAWPGIILCALILLSIGNTTSHSYFGCPSGLVGSLLFISVSISHWYSVTTEEVYQSAWSAWSDTPPFPSCTRIVRDAATFHLVTHSQLSPWSVIAERHIASFFCWRLCHARVDVVVRCVVSTMRRRDGAHRVDWRDGWTDRGWLIEAMFERFAGGWEALHLAAVILLCFSLRCISSLTDSFSAARPISTALCAMWWLKLTCDVPSLALPEFHPVFVRSSNLSLFIRMFFMVMDKCVPLE